MKEIYFDNAATTKPSKEVIHIMTEALEVNYGNPSSLHRKGMQAENYIRETTEILSKIINADKSEIYYTSGGSESNNMAILGVADAYRRTGKHILTTEIEHPAVSSPMNYLQEKGYEITYLKVDHNGMINLEELEKYIKGDTILVSIMMVNNEIGALQPIEEIGKIIKKKNKNTIFHVDGIQAFGKYAINTKRLNIDLLSISGHKFHGPKGIGALYIKKGTKITPLIFGGGHQKGLRAGTENVSGIAGLGKAAYEAYNDLDKNNKSIKNIKDYMIELLFNNIDDIKLNGSSDEKNSPYILNISIKNIKSEVLLHALEDEGIYISTGSACSTHKTDVKSPTLEAIGLNKEQIDSSIRFSFSKYTTKEEVESCIQVLKKLIPRLRMFTRGGRKK